MAHAFRVWQAFCEREHVTLVVRSHQYVREGVKFMHGGHLATLFSARNYFELDTNDSALLLVAADEQGALRVRAKKLAHRVRAAAPPAPAPKASTPARAPAAARGGQSGRRASKAVRRWKGHR